MPNIWSTDQYIYQSTLSGVHVYDSDTEAMLWLVGYAAGVNSVWANDTYLYMATTNSGVYRCSVSTISGAQDTHQYLSYPDITDNYVKYIHGADKYLCVSTASGVDHINMMTSARSYTDLDYGSSKCLQTIAGRFYYLQDDYMPSGWAYRRKISLSQPTIKNDIVYVELPYNEYDIMGYGVPASGIGNRYDTYFDFNTGKAYRKDLLVAYGPNVFTSDAACSAAENSSDAHKALPPNTDSWGDWNTPDSSWYYDFGPGSGIPICRVDIKPGSLTSTGYGYSPTEVAGSHDGVSFDIITAQTTEPAKTLHSVEFENATAYRYIRLRSTSTVNILIMELYAYDAIFDWQETQLPAGNKIFPKGESLVHGGVVYTHYANNNFGDPNNMTDGDLTTYCQGMTYLAVDFGENNEQVVSFIKLCAYDKPASDRIEADTPDIQGSNDSTDGNDGTWDTLAAVGTIDWEKPNKFPGYGPLFIPVTSDLYANVTVGGTATAGSGDANLVFDGTNATYLDPGTTPNNWIQYEFDEPKLIGRLAVRPANSTPVGVSFYGSNTGQFSGEEILMGGVTTPSYNTWYNVYLREQTIQPYKFIRAIIRESGRISELRYYEWQRTFNTTPYRWYRLSGFAASDSLKLSQWELYEGDGLSTFNYNNTKSDGSDLRFRQIPPDQAAIYWQGGEPIDNLTEIPHMIDHWTTSGTSYIKTLPAEGTTEFYMYYGNPSAYQNENQAAFTVHYTFDSTDDLYSFNKAPDSSDRIALDSGVLKIQNDGNAWDCGIMANELMLDRAAFMPGVSGTNPTFSSKVYMSQGADTFTGLYTRNDLFNRSTEDSEIRVFEGYFRIYDEDVSSGELTNHPFEYYTWYELKIELLKAGCIHHYRKVGDSNWTTLSYNYSWRADNKALYPGISAYYRDRVLYTEDMSIDLTYYDTSSLLEEEVYNPLINGVKFITIYNNTSNWIESTAGHVYIPGDGVIKPDVLFNDISVLEGVSRYSEDDNLILLATTNGVIVVEERQNDEENSKFMYYLLE